MFTLSVQAGISRVKAVLTRPSCRATDSDHSQILSHTEWPYGDAAPCRRPVQGPLKLSIGRAEDTARTAHAVDFLLEATWRGALANGDRSLLAAPAERSCSMPGSLVGLLVAVTLVFGGRHGFLVSMRQGLELGAPWPSWLERHVAVPRDQVTYAAKEPAHA